MEKEFVPYEVALKMKAIGFDEPCMASRDMGNGNGLIQIPLFQQVFRWFREKYRLLHFITPNTTRGGWDIQVIHYNGYKILYENNDNDLKYEEAELACLDKLLEIIENKSE